MTKILGDPVEMGLDHCPQCNAPMEVASGVGGDYKPNPKDISVCIKCGGINMYGEDMTLEEFPLVLLDTLEEDLRRQILQAIEVVKAVNRQINHEKTNGKT